jgi:hypothetical protein
MKTLIVILFAGLCLTVPAKVPDAAKRNATPHRWYEAKLTRGRYVEPPLCLMPDFYIAMGDRLSPRIYRAWEALSRGEDIKYCKDPLKRRNSR